MNKTDVKILKRGLKRVALALLTTATFLLGMIGLVGVALVKGYLAVLLFLISLVVLAIAFCLLYAHGVNRHIECEESEGEKNEHDITL